MAEEVELILIFSESEALENRNVFCKKPDSYKVLLISGKVLPAADKRVSRR